MNFSTISAILRGRWLIDKSYAESQLPIIVGILKNRQGNFAIEGELKDAKNNAPEKLSSISATSVYKVGHYTELSKLPKGSIAFVDLVGPIMKYGGFCSYGSVDKANILRNIDNASNISGVILNVDSPGGQVDGTTLLADQIKSMSKPVVAMVDDGMMASAAMWIGSAATEIYATKKSDSFGSIGVYATLYDWNAYMKAEGLPVHEIYAPQSVEKNKDYRDALAGDYAAMKDDLGEIANIFIQTIESNRPSAAGSKDKWSKGGMFMAAEAKKMGLIDGIKSFDQIVDRVSTLANQFSKNKKSNMSAGAFQKTLAASGSESFEVVENGFLLTEEQLNSIEASIASSENAAANAATAIQEHEILDAANVAQINELTEANTTQAARISELEAEVERLNAGTHAPLSTSKDADSFSNEKELSETTKEANRLRAMKGLPPIR